MAVKNYYSILGVSQTDSKEVIRKAYRRLAKQYHPDLTPGDKSAEEKMREIGEAWETLGDDGKRARYDELLAGGPGKKPIVSGPSTAPKASRPMTQEDFFHMTRSFDHVLSPEAIKASTEQKRPVGRNPLDTTAMFEQFMGIKNPKKKG